MLIGPLPFLSFKPRKILVHILTALVGSGFGCAVVSTFARSLQSVMKMGFENNINTYLTISGKKISEKKKQNSAKSNNIPSALEDHEKSDLDPDQDHLPKSDLRSRSDPDLT